MPKITLEDLRSIAGYTQIEHVSDIEVEADRPGTWRFTSPTLLSYGKLETARVAVVIYTDEHPALRSNCDFGSTRLAAATWLIRRAPLGDGALYVVEDGLETSQQTLAARRRWKAAIREIVGPGGGR